MRNWGLGLGAWGLGQQMLDPHPRDIKPQVSSLKPADRAAGRGRRQPTRQTVSMMVPSTHLTTATG